MESKILNRWWRGVAATLLLAAFGVAGAQDFPTQKGDNARTGTNASPSTSHPGQANLVWWKPDGSTDIGRILIRNNTSTEASRTGAWTDPTFDNEADGAFIPAATGDAAEDLVIGLQPPPPAALDPGYAFAYTVPAGKGTDPTTLEFGADTKSEFTWLLQPANLLERAARSYALYVWLPSGPSRDALSGDPIYPQRYYVYEISYGTGKTLFDIVDTFQSGSGWVRLGNGGRITNAMFDYDGTTPISITLHNTVPRKPGAENTDVPDPVPSGYDWTQIFTDVPYTSVVYADAVMAVPEIGSYRAQPIVSALDGAATDIRSVRALNQSTTGERQGQSVTISKGVVVCEDYDTGLVRWSWSPLDESEFAITRDNDSAQTTANAPWAADTIATGFKGTNYHAAPITAVPGTEAAMVYAPTLVDGTYEILAWLPGSNSGELFGEQVQYEIREGATINTVTVNQDVAGGWVRIGARRYNHDSALGAPLTVHVTNLSVLPADATKKAYADAIRFVGATSLEVNSTPVMLRALIKPNLIDPPGEIPVVLVADENGRIYCLDADGNADGTTNVYWAYPTTTDWAVDPNDTATEDQGAEMPDGFDLSSALVQRIAGSDYLYIAGRNGRVYCIDMAGRGDMNLATQLAGTTRRLWSYPDDRPASPRPTSLGPIKGSVLYADTADGPTVFVGSAEGRIYALSALGNANKTTSLRWAYPGIDASALSTFTSEVRNAGDAAWVAPGNAAATDAVYAVATPDTGAGGTGETEYLQAVAPTGLTIPATATIKGIEFEVVRSRTAVTNSALTIKDVDVKVVQGGVIQTVVNRADPLGDWPTTDTTKVYGNSTDLWGATWTPADFGAGFGLAIAVKGNGNSTTDTVPIAQIDSILVKVYYQVTPVGPIEGTPTIAFGNLYFGTKGRDSGTPSAWSNTVTYGLGDLVTGSDNKVYQSAQNSNLANDPALALNVPTWWVPASGGRFFALDMDTGDLVWQFAGTTLWGGGTFVPADDFVSGPVAIPTAEFALKVPPDPDMIVVANQNRWITALNAATGTVLWTTNELGSPVSGNLTYSPLNVFDGLGGRTLESLVLVPTDDGRLSGLFAYTGLTNLLGTRRAWEYVLEGDRPPTSAAVGRSWMYVGDSAGYFYAFNDSSTILGIGEAPGQQTIVENNLDGAMFRQARIRFVTREVYTELRENMGFDPLLAKDPDYFQYENALDATREVTRTAFDWGETIYALVYNFPYRILDTASNPVAPPFVNFQVNVDGTAFRSMPVQSSQWNTNDSEAAEGAGLGYPNFGGVNLNGYAILAFTLQGGGPNTLPPGVAQMQTSVTTASLNNVGRPENVALDPTLSKRSFTVANPLSLVLKFTAGVPDLLHSIGYTADPADPDNAVNGSPDIDATLNEREDLAAAPFGMLDHNQTGRYTIGVVDRSLMTLLRGATRGLNNVRVTRSGLAWQGGESAVYKPFPQDLFPFFEDLPYESPNRSLDYPDITADRLRVQRSELQNAIDSGTLGGENPLYDSVSLVPPANVDELDPLTRTLQATLFDLFIDVPRFQPPNLSEVTDSALALIDGGYYGRMRVYVDSNGDQLLTDSGGRREAFRSFNIASGVDIDERFEVATPTVDLGTLAQGSAYDPRKPQDQTAAGFLSSFGDLFKPYAVLNVGNVNLLNLRMAKAYEDGGTLPWELFSSSNHELGWLDGSTNLHTDIDTYLAPLAQVVLQKPRVGDRQGASLSPNPIRRENSVLGVSQAPLLEGVDTGQPKLVVSIPLGSPVGTYVNLVRVIEDADDDEVLDPGESYSEPTLTLKFTVGETRLTNSFSDTAAPMIDDLIDGSERYRIANGQPAGLRDSNGNLVVLFTSSRSQYAPVDPAADAETAAENPQWRLYGASVEGRTPGASAGASPLADLSEFVPSGTNAWFRQDTGPFPAPGDVEAMFGSTPTASIVAGTAKFGSPVFPAWGVFNPFSVTFSPLIPPSVNPVTYFAFVGDTQKQTDRGRVNESRVVLGEATIQPTGAVALANAVPIPARGDSPAPAGELFDPQMPKGRPSLVQAGEHATVFYSAGGTGQTRIYWAEFDGTNWMDQGVLDTGSGFEWVAGPSAFPRVYRGATPALDEDNNPLGPQIIELTFAGKLRGSSNSEVFMTRIWSNANAQVIDALQYLPVRTLEELTQGPTSGTYRSLGVEWNPEVDVDLQQSLGGAAPASVLVASTKKVDRDTGVVSFETTLGGTVYLDPATGSVRFANAQPRKDAVLYLTYQPAFVRVAGGSGANLTTPAVAFDERLISEFGYWATSGNLAVSPGSPDDQIPADRYLVSFNRAASGTSQTSRPHLKTFRFGLVLPTAVHTSSNGTVTLLQVAGALGPYQIDPVAGKIYFTDRDEDNSAITVTYTGADPSNGSPWPGLVASGTVGLVEERGSAPVPMQGAVSESQLNLFLDITANDFDPDYTLRRPGLAWMLWTSTRNGAPDLFLQTIAPRFTPSAVSGS